MDLTGVFAIVLSLVCILGGNALEGGHLSSLIQPTAAIIVFGGTIGATWLAATPTEVKTLARLMKRILIPGLADRARTTQDLLRVAGVARREGMLSVEGQLADVQDETLRRGLQMLVDGTPGDDVYAMLEVEAELEEHHACSAAKLLETAGGFSPTIGILGAVLGLIHVMQNLSDPSKLGTGIAVAFVATIYGVGFANLLFLPLGTRLKKIIQTEAEDRAMVLTGLEAIVTGSNARQIGERLSPYYHGHAEASGKDKGADKPAGDKADKAAA
ncbi:MAG: flagellar motor protein [Pseudomonadota bacterium]|nr:flagellar motor protein [Pseudomonadota bacterium]